LVYATLKAFKNLTLGNGSKKGPMARRMRRMKRHEKTLAICVFPPTFCWIKLRESDAANGTQEKNELNKLPQPWTNQMWIK